MALTQNGIIGEDEARRVLSDDPDSDLSFIVAEDIPSPPEPTGGEFDNALPDSEGFSAATDEEKSVGLLEKIKDLIFQRKDEGYL